MEYLVSHQHGFDRCYPEKCRDRLYPEFVAGGIARKRNPDV